MRVRFRVGLVAALLGLLLSTVALITTTTYLSVRKSLEELSERVLSQAIGRVELRVDSQLDVAVGESRLDSALIERGVLPLTGEHPDWDAVGAYFLNQLASGDGPALSFGLDATGEACIVLRRRTGAPLLRFLRKDAEGQLDLTDFVRGDRGLEEVTRLRHKGENDPRPRAYYLAAKAARRAIWTDTFVFFGESGVADSPGVTYATPVLRPDGSLLGVLTADFDLRAVSEFLASIRVLRHGVPFLVEYAKDGTRRVIAHPSPGILIRRLPSGETELTPTAELSDRPVAKLVERLPDVLPEKGEGVAPIRFDLDGTEYIGSFEPLRRDGGLGWAVCVVVPVEDILGAVWHSNHVVGAIVAASLVVAVLVAFWLGAVIARPLRELADDADAIGRFELDSRAAGHSRVIEMDTLATAMEEMKRGLRSFRKYVPAELVRELLASGDEARVGGTRRELTIHFSDIVGFTSVAETLPPERLMESLGEYLEEMTQPIVASGGTVDKYIGDAVMAFWGAPKPDADHALHACQAALVNHARLEALNARWQGEGRPRLEARVALHTGEVVVGNVGSGDRLNYTIIGDAVNLASRLEGLNKRYGTHLMISETTWERVSARMVARPLDRVAVKGKAERVVIYELLGAVETVGDNECKAAARHAEAFRLYLSRGWSEAAALLRAALEERPGDEPARILLERCERWIASPPADDWDGTEHMTEK